MVPMEQPGRCHFLFFSLLFLHPSGMKIVLLDARSWTSWRCREPLVSHNSGCIMQYRETQICTLVTVLVKRTSIGSLAGTQLRSITRDSSGGGV